MFEFLSSPFGLVAVGLGVLAVAVLALCLWITTLDRRMRGMADGLEAERRKVAEMQMVIGRRNNAARSYGRRGGPASAAGMTGAVAPAPAPAPAGVPPQASSAPAPAPRAAAPRAVGPAAAPVAAGAPMAAAPAPGVQPGAPRAARRPAGAAPAGRPGPAAAPAAPRAGAAARRRGGGWAPEQGDVVVEEAVEAWVQGGSGAQQGIVMPDKKMSRKARREAERAFAARAAAELEARQARRAQEGGIPRGPQRGPASRAGAQPGVRPYGGPAAPQRGSHAPAPSAVPTRGVVPGYGGADARGRHAR